MQRLCQKNICRYHYLWVYFCICTNLVKPCNCARTISFHKESILRWPASKSMFDIHFPLKIFVFNNIEFEIAKVLFYSLTESRLNWTPQNNLNIVISWLFWFKLPNKLCWWHVDFLHRVHVIFQTFWTKEFMKLHFKIVQRCSTYLKFD